MVASAIRPAEFLAAVKKIWSPYEARRGPFTPSRIGLCVSGGPDSMALAYLCSRLRDEGLAPQLKATAYIVDHKARPESTDEAQTVASYLEKLGLTSKILTIQWPEDKDTWKFLRFETEARTRRYRLLAEACLEDDVSSLLLGHHADDQTETVLMRMAYNLGAFTGLKGIVPVKPIPCCSDIYGSDPRGWPLRLHNTRTWVRPMDAPFPAWRKLPMRSEFSAFSSSIVSHRGHTKPSGIILLRPLYEDTKDRLIATCQENGVPYVSDPTNSDPTYTVRNACRHLLSNHKVPQALQRPRLMSIARQASSEHEFQEELADILLREFQLDLNLRNGSMTLQIPKTARSVLADAQLNVRTGLERVLARLIDVVNPLEKHDDHHRSRRPQLERLSEGMFSALAADGHEPGPVQNYDKVTIQPVMSQGKTVTNVDSTHTWHLLRKKPHRHETEQTLSFSFDGPQKSSSGNTERSKSKWMLWDGRYWIQLLNKPLNDDHWGVRFLRHEDMSVIRKRLARVPGGTGLTQINELLSSAASGKLRFTLPAIVDGKDQPRFLPSLGVTVPYKPLRQHQSGGRNEDGIDYQISYKAIDPVIREQIQGTAGSVKRQDILSTISLVL